MRLDPSNSAIGTAIGKLGFWGKPEVVLLLDYNIYGIVVA